MKLTKDEEIRLGHLLAPLKKNPKVQEMKNFKQHGKISTYDHVDSVTRTSFWINRRFKLGANEKSLAIGAFLHDFYLYDWHKDENKEHRLHGFSHPEAAAKNACKFFKINAKEKDIISHHMWPLTITKIPKSKEAWIVCFADKYVAAKETLFCR